MLGREKKLLLCFSLVALLSACAEMPKKVADIPAPSLDSMLAKASVASNTGQSEQALTQLKSATGLFPAEKKPWLQMAQLNFDGANYGEAINNALEVLQRDPADKVANSIVAVSGLRLSTKALADLIQQNNLNGSVRTEAEGLAKLLRESLGESLVIAPVKKMAYGQSKQSQSVLTPAVAGGAGVASGGSRAPLPKTETVAGKTVSVEVKKSDSNPFGSLK
jgi:tetratricopeptide (TPR) repeat protein